MLSFENIGDEVAQIVNPAWKQPRKIYLCKEDDIPLLNGSGFLKLELDEPNKFEPSLNKNIERTVTYVSGQSGSGKSYYTGQLLKKYKKLHPKNEIYIFSSVDADKSLDVVKPKRIKLDDLATEDLQCEDFENSLVVLDDCDCISNKLIKNKIQAIQHLLLEKGRHTKTSVIVTSHITCAGNETKRILNEAHSIVVFPTNMNNRSMKYLFDSYLGMDKHQIKYIRGLKTRAFTILKSYPSLVISDGLISITKHLLDPTNTTK